MSIKGKNMPAEVKVLVKGYTNADSVAETGEEKTQPAIALIKDGDLVIVSDPGVLESQQILIDALQKENLTVDDVNVVFITHSHIDHYRNIGMFPKAKTLEYFGLWDKSGVESWSEDFTPNIKVLYTPGHDYTGLTLFATTQDGVVAVCGDIFWKKDYPLEPQDDSYASDFKKLKESREMVLKMADWIVPGHGEMYKNNRIIEGAKEERSIEDKETKITLACRKCGRQMKQTDRCQCRPKICFKCCECHLDCDLCGCSHKR